MVAMPTSREEHSTGKVVALKVSHRSLDASAELYRRCVRAIEFLRGLDDASGILPLLDAQVPVCPTKADPPWPAMPLATVSREALKSRARHLSGECRTLDAVTRREVS